MTLYRKEVKGVERAGLIVQNPIMSGIRGVEYTRVEPTNRIR